MIEIYKKTEQGVVKIDEPRSGSWIHITDPSPDDLAWVESALHVPHSFMASALDVDELARIDREGDRMLIILRLPYFAGDEDDMPYRTIPLGIVLMPDSELIVTLCRQRISLPDDLLELRPGRVSPGKRNRLILRIMQVTAQKYLVYVRQIDAKVDEIEERLKHSQRNAQLLQLLRYQKSFVYITTGLKSNLIMMDRLQRNQTFAAFPEDLELLEDVMLETAQASEMASTSSNILNQMMDAFASIINNHVNSVMKFLASITVMLALPTLVASIYGMNVGLPLQEHPLGFVIVMGVAVGLSALVAVIFWKRDWF
jgi:magnesium transporter